MTDNYSRKSTSYSTESKFKLDESSLTSKITIYSPLTKEPIMEHRKIISVCLKLEIFQKKNGLLSRALNIHEKDIFKEINNYKCCAQHMNIQPSQEKCPEAQEEQDFQAKQ